MSPLRSLASSARLAFDGTHASGVLFDRGMPAACVPCTPEACVPFGFETRSCISIGSRLGSMKRAAACASLNLGHERRRRFHFIESYVQRSETAQAKVFPPDNRLVLDDHHVLSAAGECFEYQLALDACQGRTETEVTGPAESQMTII